MGKQKGSNAERELVQMLWGSGFAAVRVAGSGVSKYPSPDIVASNGSRILAIECKTTLKDHQYFHPEQISQLIGFAEQFKATPILAVKFTNKGWFFFSPEDLEKTPSHNLVIKRKDASKGKFLLDLKNEI